MEGQTVNSIVELQRLGAVVGNAFDKQVSVRIATLVVGRQRTRAIAVIYDIDRTGEANGILNRPVHLLGLCDLYSLCANRDRMSLPNIKVTDGIVFQDEIGHVNALGTAQVRDFARLRVHHGKGIPTVKGIALAGRYIHGSEHCLAVYKRWRLDLRRPAPGLQIPGGHISRTAVAAANDIVHPARLHEQRIQNDILLCHHGLIHFEVYAVPARIGQRRTVGVHSLILYPVRILIRPGIILPPREDQMHRIVAGGANVADLDLHRLCAAQGDQLAGHHAVGIAASGQQHEVDKVILLINGRQEHVDVAVRVYSAFAGYAVEGPMDRAPGRNVALGDGDRALECDGVRHGWPGIIEFRI